ncbi:endolytic transglycosylase MltG [Phascolarctobacterium sp.]
MRKVLPFILGIFLVVVVGAYWVLNYTGSNKDLATGSPYLITVEPGMTTADIANLLHKQKLVKTPEAFRLEAKFRGLERELQAGRYEITAGMSNSEIVEVLSKGQVQRVSFTVPEGYTVVKTAKKIEAEGLGSAEKFIEAARNYTPYPYMETSDPNVIYKAEGFIFPSTYMFDIGMNEKEMLAMMVREFNTQMNKENIQEEAEKQKMSIRDLVNMAALVEMEAVFKEEQPRIAGVFLRRLEIYMPIQSDTTIQYILGTQKEEITIADTRIKNPYNTYQNPGLPPGPIASPGMSAVKAVLKPEKTEYLYFVAEKDGHHRFTKTYAEHLKAIEDIHGPQ